MSSSSKDEDESEDDDNQRTECTGVTVEWKPGSVWNMYIPISSMEKDLCLCSFCHYIPNSVDFKKFMERAVEAPAHTPWPYLNYVTACYNHYYKPALLQKPWYAIY
jgi:hypothetical protein